MNGTRREFIRATSTAALLTGVPGGWAGGVYAADGPEAPKIRIGIIALTDCASIVMAHELGLFKKHGIESTISKEASWAVIRDRLTLGENQATHMLLGIPYAATMGAHRRHKRPLSELVAPLPASAGGSRGPPPPDTEVLARTLGDQQRLARIATYMVSQCVAAGDYDKALRFG